MDFNVVSCVEVINHVCTRLLVAVVKDVFLGVHVPFDLVDLIGAVRTVLGHDDGALEFSLNKVLVVSLEPVLD